MKTFDTTPTGERVYHTKCWLTPILMAVKGERKNPKCPEEKPESCVSLMVL